MSQCLNPDCLRQNPINPKFCQSCGAKLLLSDRYRAIKIIGQGGFGRTFLAVDEQKPLKPRCVIKQFLPQVQGTQNTKKAAKLFSLEAVRLNELGHHDQIPELMAYVTQDERQYLVQEFIDGQNLTEELSESGSFFKESQIRELLNDLLPVLEFIHKGQVIHRDIKPDNIIRRKQDNKLVLVDFGAAKVVTGTALAKTGTMIGSAEYVAPEQARGKAIFASDLYSLGVTCIYLMTIISPFDLLDSHENTWVWRQLLVNNPVSDELGNILDKLIDHAINRRYQSATEIIQALNPPLTQPIFSTTSSTPQYPSNKSITSVNIPATVLKRPALERWGVGSGEWGVGWGVQLPHLPRTLLSRLGLVANIPLKTARMDYTKLRDLLAAGQWKEADLETNSVMLQAAGRTKEGYLDYDASRNFPPEDLRTIDQLWLQYSNGRFGFSVQKKIWVDKGGKLDGSYDFDTYVKLAEKVGWRKGGSWLNYDQLTFNTNAPLGHLPSGLLLVRVLGWSGVEWVWCWFFGGLMVDEYVDVMRVDGVLFSLL